MNAFLIGSILEIRGRIVAIRVERMREEEGKE
jgi:hypothetical protein